MQADVSRSSVQGNVIKATNPRNNEALPDVPTTPLKDIPGMIERGRIAQAAWAKTPMTQRAEALMAIQQEFLKAAPELLGLITNESGKPTGEALLADIVTVSDVFAFWAAMGPTWLSEDEFPLPEANMPGKKLKVGRVPQGVVAVISTWNYPVALPVRNFAPALLAGNAVIFKPSEWSPRVGARLAQCFTNVLPKDLLQLVQGDGRQGMALITGSADPEHAAADARGVDFVSFTGSAGSGRTVGQLCAERYIPHSLELGGKDAAIIRSDADLDRTVRGILWGGMTNAGQNCAALERVYVHESIHDAFVEKLVAAVKGLRAVGGDAAVSGEPEVGPLTMPTQRDFVHKLVTEAAQAGATVRCGGKIPAGPGRYYPPTVITNMADEMRLAKEESFGPVVAVFKYKTDDEAVRRANASAYGLNASVWTRDLSAGEALARTLRAGTVLVNNHGFTAALPMAPWGGSGKSGYGSTNGRDALNHFTRPQSVLIDTNRENPDLWWHPYNEALNEAALALIELGRKDGNPQAAMGRLMNAMGKRFAS